MGRVPEREAARAADERFYFTGKACKNGHVGKRYTANGLCATCAIRNTLKSAAKQPEHPNRIAARAAGAIHYAQGKPCRHGHEDRRFVSNGICVQCADERCKRWHERNPGHMAAGARRRRAADPTGHRAGSKRWAKKNKQKVVDLLRRWKKANPERARELARVGANNRRTRKVANGGTFTRADIEAIYLKQNGTCAACPATERLEIDHVLPVILGGSSDPSNLQLLCLPCNRSKGSKHPDTWKAERLNYLQVTCDSVFKS